MVPSSRSKSSRRCFGIFGRRTIWPFRAMPTPTSMKIIYVAFAYINNTCSRCFIFEMLSPHFRRVALHDPEQIVFLGARDLKTLREVDTSPYLVRYLEFRAFIYSWQFRKSISGQQRTCLTRSAPNMMPKSSFPTSILSNR